MNDIADQYKEQYEIGFTIFEKLFRLGKEDFIVLMKNIFQDNKEVMQILDNKPTVIKTSKDDVPDEILICFYSMISINHLGVQFKPEHGSSSMILKFNKFFNIDIALKELK